MQGGFDMTQLYEVRLIDYGTPSFVSATREYLGDIESIKKVINCLSDNNRDRLMSALNDYLQGGKGEVSVLYEKSEPLLKSAIIKKVVKRNIKKFKYTFMNVWNCPYYMLADNLEETVYYVKIGNKYYRYISCVFTNLGYKNSLIDDIKNNNNFTEEEKKELLSKMSKIDYVHDMVIDFWGHPGIISCNGNITKNNLFFL